MFGNGSSGGEALVVDISGFQRVDSSDLYIFEQMSTRRGVERLNGSGLEMEIPVGQIWLAQHELLYVVRWSSARIRAQKLTVNHMFLWSTIFRYAVIVNAEVGWYHHNRAKATIYISVVSRSQKQPKDRKSPYPGSRRHAQSTDRTSKFQKKIKK